jgi:cytochrome P450
LFRYVSENKLKLFDRSPTKRNPSFTAVNRRIRETIRCLVARQHVTTPDTGDLLARILGGSESGTMSGEEIVDDLIAFTIARIEATAGVLSWTLHRLAEQPTLQRPAVSNRWNRRRCLSQTWTEAGK